MNIYRISTTEYDIEDFYLHTELSKEDIIEVITPIVNAEREGLDDYDNEVLFDALQKKYQRKKIELLVDIDTIKI
jgi:folate-dependent tRNA-U54 methylase TrmFO/GidA